MKFKTIIQCVLICLVDAKEMHEHDCHECIAEGGSQCILKSDWSYTMCCEQDVND